MLGTGLDYLILRGLATRQNMATEAELDERFAQVSLESFDAEMPKFNRVIDRFEGHLPIDPSLRYLDMGCGTGELTIAFAKLGIQDITGVDFLARAIARARGYARKFDVESQAHFVCSDVHGFRPERPFDVLLSFDALEHIDNPRAFLIKMADWVAPGGVAVLAFGPLFHSPFGDHMWEFFRVQIPWRGVLFSEAAILRVRREYFRPTDPKTRYQDIAEGLNRMRYSEFVSHVHAAGWYFDYLAVNTFLYRLPPLRRVSDTLMRVPGLGDYFAHNVYAVLRRTSSVARMT
jgi:cyclopropane fatty-acyl-phospholipid synthase-like methyltransferase